MMSNSTAYQARWVDEPDGRGTWSILSTCILTIILCCWSSVYPNIPPRSAGTLKKETGKINLFLIGLLSPELFLPMALGQWSSARASVKRFREAGYENWTLAHAFFADMGGFLLESPGSEMFPVDAEQLFWLIKDGFVVYPEVDIEDIQDKSKSEGMAILISVLQAAWFLINCIIRLAQHLFVTTLELTTISFIIIFFATSFCWRDKPKDISRAIILTTNTPITTIRSRYHPYPEERWYHTPLCFLSRDEAVVGRLWRYYIQILHYLRIPVFARPRTKLYDHFPSDTFPRLDKTAEGVGAPFVLLFSSTFMSAWNLEFPTPTEKLLWRIAAVYHIVFGVVGGISIWYADEVVFPKRLGKTELFENPPKRQLSRLAWKLRNIHPDRDPDLTLPLSVLLPNVLISVAYCLLRIYILVEDVIGLRKLPEDAFQTVSWSKYIPHW